MHLAIWGRPLAALELAATARLHTPELVFARALACYRAGRPDLAERILAEDLPPSEIVDDDRAAAVSGAARAVVDRARAARAARDRRARRRRDAVARAREGRAVRRRARRAVDRADRRGRAPARSRACRARRCISPASSSTSTRARSPPRSKRPVRGSSTGRSPAPITTCTATGVSCRRSRSSSAKVRGGLRNGELPGAAL